MSAVALQRFRRREWGREASLDGGSLGAASRSAIVFDATNLLIDRLYLPKQYHRALTTLAVVGYCPSNVYQWHPRC